MKKYNNPISSYKIKNATKDAEKRKEYWNTGIGLNQVDGLEPSQYLIDLAEKNIEGVIETKEVKELLASHYDQNKTNSHYECDLVSTRIVELLEQDSFTFSPQTLKCIHKYLFDGIFEDRIVGKFRDYNISKEEEILNGNTVNYGNWNMINDLYAYDFEQEKGYRYTSPIDKKQIEHLADFVSRIWQVHPFGEGNTRTTAVFTELYLRSMGFDINNEMFKNHSTYFRGALVRSNYRNVKDNVDVTYEYLHKFFSNLLAGTKYELNEKELYCSNKENNYLKQEMLQDRVGMDLER